MLRVPDGDRYQHLEPRIQDNLSDNLSHRVPAASLVHHIDNKDRSRQGPTPMGKYIIMQGFTINQV